MHAGRRAALSLMSDSWVDMVEGKAYLAVRLDLKPRADLIKRLAHCRCVAHQPPSHHHISHTRTHRIALAHDARDRVPEPLLRRVRVVSLVCAVHSGGREAAGRGAVEVEAADVAHVEGHAAERAEVPLERV